MLRSPASSGCCLAPGRTSAGRLTHQLAPEQKENQTPHLQRQLNILRLIHPRERDLRALIELGDVLGSTPGRPRPEVARTIATRDEGIAPLLALLEDRLQNLTEEARRALRKRRALAELTAIVEHKIRQKARAALTGVDLDRTSGLTVRWADGTETVFGLDGMGLYFVNSLSTGETYNVMAWLLITAVMVVIFNLIADITLGFLDPRIRLE